MPNASGQPLPGEPGYVAPNQSSTPANPAGGLINNATPTTTPAPTAPQQPLSAPQATASSTTATPFTVAPNQLVSSNVKDIISSDSPLMQQAASRAADQVNQRGLLNSSIGISAGASALYDAALPIASADAATYDRAASNTAQAQNTAALQTSQLQTGISQANAQNTTQLQLQSIQANTQLSVVDRQTAMQKTIAEANNATQEKLQRIQSDTSLSVADKQTASAQLIAQHNNETSIAVAETNAASSLANIDADGKIRTNIAQLTAANQALIQSSQTAGSLYQTTLASIADIARDPNIADKAGAIANQLRTLSDGLGVVGDIHGLNLGANLSFDGTGGSATGTTSIAAPVGVNAAAWATAKAQFEAAHFAQYGVPVPADADPALVTSRIQSFLKP